MADPVRQYWQLRFIELKKTLEKNEFMVHLADDGAEACDIVLNTILPATAAKSISWGGSVTFTSLGLYDTLKGRGDLQVIDTFDRECSHEERLERRRRALLVDLFITGTNVLTDTGKLVNLDMIGNRIGALTFGPRQVVILVGRNKIVADVDEAMVRIKTYVAPANALRLQMKTPCVKTGYCEECESRERICNTWTITEKSYPRHRIHIVLINQDLGL
jgi:L-lactate utilization protein LutB